MWRRFLETFGFGRAAGRWVRAQGAELDFWRAVAREGYAGIPAAEFLERQQRPQMLSAVDFLPVPRGAWRDATVVEFGSGPAGVVEWIEAARRIAVEPLVDEYRRLFPHLERSAVEYLARSAEGPLPLPAACADLVVCYNMLDHVADPGAVVAEMGRVARPGATLLFQVNVYADEAALRAKTGLHAELHPASFTRASALALLARHRFTPVREQFRAEATPETGEHFFLAALVCEGPS